jgi:hypothetical protein
LPDDARAAHIADTLRRVDALLRPRDVLRVYRGVTSGEPGGSFTACGAQEAWEFKGNLRAFTASQRLSLPAAGPDSARGAGYYVEVYAAPAPEWLARRWGSRYARVLQAFHVTAVRPWTGAECGRAR